MSRFTDLAHRFARDARGAIAVVFGLSLMVMMLCAALALDSSRTYDVKTRVQAALDAAALAGAKVLDPDDYNVTRITDAAVAYFNAYTRVNAIDGVMLNNFTAIPHLANRTVEATVDVRVDTLFGALSGLSGQFDFSQSSKTRFVNRKVEVALVVDITGSMCNPCSKVDDLKDAAKQLVDVLYSQHPEAGAIKISLVPYAASVNVGSAYFNTVASGTSSAIDTCVMERDGSQTYTNAAPSSGNHFESTGNTPNRPGYSCPTSEIVPLTDLSTQAGRDDFKDEIDALTTSGATAGHIGLGWGWYTVSPEWNSIWPQSSKPKPYREDVRKAVILMTDGMFNRSYWNGGSTLTDAERIDPLVPGSSGYQTLQLCTAIKDRVAEPYGPTIYTVSFQAPTEADALMQQCAGAGNAYTAANRDTLIAAFTDIVERLTNLAITN